MNLSPAPIKSTVLDDRGYFNRIWSRWFSDLVEYIRATLALATGEPLFTGSPAYGITSTDITHWNTAFTAEHPAVTITGDGLELIGQQLQLTNPLQKLSGGRLILGDLSFINIAGVIYIQRTTDGGTTWTDTGTSFP